MGIKVRGVKQSKSGLNRIINDVKGRKVVRALQSAMIIASSQAAIYTPIDTSTLLNSQYRELINNGVRLTGRVGYTANYAVFVHDPNVPQTFRRAAAEKAQEIINYVEQNDITDECLGLIQNLGNVPAPILTEEGRLVFRLQFMCVYGE